MKKIEIKHMLRDMGLNPILTEMPCVIEPIYQRCKDKTLEEVKDTQKIGVHQDGNCCNIYGRCIILNKDGTATILGENTYSGYKITTNNLGIETSYYDGSWIDHFTSISRRYGLITKTWGNNGNGTYYSNSKLDTGLWSIQETR